MNGTLPTKQVIVIRRDLKMRRGKEISQGAHASMKWLTKRIVQLNLLEGSYGVGEFNEADRKNLFALELSKPEQDWVKGLFTKITCKVNSLEELLELHQKAKDFGIITEIVEDAGLTEFDGPTITAIAIGPDLSDNINKITSHLELY